MMAEVFGDVFQASLYASVVGLVILLLKSILKDKLNARWHYLIWAVLILKLLIPFGPESAVSLFNVLPEMPPTSFVAGSSEMAQQSESAIATEYPLDQAPPRQPLTAVGFAALLEYFAPYIWVVGSGLMLLWLLITYYSFYRKLRQGVLLADERLWRVFESSKAKMGVNRKIRLVLQNIVATPALFGIIRPKILLPKAVLNMNDKELEYILLHELAHYKRRDVLANYLLLVLQIIHWFNPVLWYCFQRIRQDMEVATDERVLSILESTEHKDYGQALLTVLAGFANSKLAPKLLGMVDDNKNIERRIMMIKMADFYKSRRRLVLGIGLLCVVVLGSMLLTNGLTNGDSLPNSSQYAAAALLKYKTAYVGDSSKVVNLINNLPYAAWRREVSLQTQNAPYGLTVNYDFSTLNMDANLIESTFHNNAAIMFALIDNVDTLVFRVSGTNEQLPPQSQYQHTRAEIQQDFAKDLREYAQDVQTFEGFLDVLQIALTKGVNFKIWVFPEKYAPSMSSTPGIRILSEYSGAVSQVRYSTETGGLFTWAVATGQISEAAKTIELPYGTPAYWSPVSPEGEIFKGADNKITITFFNEQNKKVEEKSINIQYDDAMYYRVQPASEVMIGVTAKPQSIEEAVGQAIKAQGRSYLSGEVTTEGHRILESAENNGIVKAYTIASIGNFGFENGIFTKVSGSGAIPTVITFSKNEKGEYFLIEYKEPQDGALYGISIREMFPKHLLSEAQKASASYPDLVNQQVAQAQAYLFSQGRKAPISENYVEKQYPDLPDNVRNDLDSKFKYELMGYPDYLGTREVLENGVRYIYAFKQERRQNDNLLIFTKSKTDGSIIEKREYVVTDSGLKERSAS